MIRFHADRIASTYWARIPEDERVAIKAAIPEGCVVRVTAGHRAKPGTASVRLLRDGFLIDEARGYLTARLVWDVLRVKA